jgi:hypothetical protein
VTPKS